jgi:hypothetical protein
MGRKRNFKPGDMVTAFTGQVGMVVSEEEFTALKKRLEEGRRPGHYFAPGCCQRPDYVIQVPVLFEDTTWDVMRALNIKKAPHPSEEIRQRIERIKKDHTG